MSNPTIEIQDAVQHWGGQYEMMAGMSSGIPESLQSLRNAAMDTFRTLGIPTTRHEEWKYTNLRPLFQREYPGTFFPVRNLPATSPSEIADRFVPPGLEAHLVVLVNGHFHPELSDIKADKVSIQSLKSAWSDQPDVVAASFGQLAEVEGRALVALNTALSQDGVFIHLPKSASAALPVYLLHLSYAESGPVASHDRLLVVAEANSEMTLIEDFRKWNGDQSLVNHVGEISVGKDARFRHVVLQDDAPSSSLVNATEVRQAGNSNYTSVVVSTNGEVVRNTLHAAHEDQHCETHMFGLYHLNGSTHVDNHTMVDHKMPNCFSNELYKGVLDGGSTGVFNGKVMVRQDAQKTNAFQSNKNILLSPEATVNTKPQLEIWADDVKCSHGATTGQLDEEALYYLRARGISKTKARALLTYAFAAEVLEAIRIEPLREYLEEKLRNRLF